MAKGTPWSERSGEQRRRTFGGFASVYAVVAVGALAVGWIPVGLIFGIGALGLGIAWMSTTTTQTATVATARDRPKPDWMLAMDDPDAPDLSRPEYRTDPRGTESRGTDPRGTESRGTEPRVTEPRAGTDEDQGPAFDRPDQVSRPAQSGTTPDQPPPVPPTPGV